MRKNKLSRLPLVLSILVLILGLILWGLIPGSGLNRLIGVFTGAYRPVAETATAAGKNSSGFVNALFNSKSLQQENSHLLEENAALKKEVQQLQTENQKYQELKAAFQIKDRYAGYEVRHAAVISRSFGNLFDMFSVNVGSADGLAGSEPVSYAVVDAEMNLVGRIDHVTTSTAKVLPLISDGFTVVSRINRAGGITVRVHGDATQAELGLCLVDGIKKDADIKVGDELVTDGSGGLFPPGLKVGTITDVMPQGDELVAILKPFTEVRDLADVFILLPTVGAPASLTGPEQTVTGAAAATDSGDPAGTQAETAPPVPPAEAGEDPAADVETATSVPGAAGASSQTDAVVALSPDLFYSRVGQMSVQASVQLLGTGRFAGGESSLPREINT